MNLVDSRRFRLDENRPSEVLGEEDTERNDLKVLFKRKIPLCFLRCSTLCSFVLQLHRIMFN